jgi:transposase-like protein
MRVLSLDRFLYICKKSIKRMNAVSCKKCGSTNAVKNGKVRNQQRYKCKDCGLNYICRDSRRKVKPEAKALAVLLYGSGKASYGMIARLLNVSRTAVLQWIRSIGKQMPLPEIDSELEEVQIDEMWHYINKKKKKYGFGEPWIVLETEPSDGLSAIVMLKPFKNFMNN